MCSGGWYCFNKENCDSRYETMRRLMSSSKWPQTKTGQPGVVCVLYIHCFCVQSETPDSHFKISIHVRFNVLVIKRTICVHPLCY